MTLRIYGKVFDKLAKNLDSDKSQFTDEGPNIMLLSFAGPGVHSSHPGVPWALDELFTCSARAARTVVPDHLTDISLDAWVEFTAEQLISEERIAADWYCEKYRSILDAPKRLGGVVLFDDTALSQARINYNARASCKVTHAEMAELESLLSVPAKYLCRK